ncbi:hypothetical protein HUG17_0470 [Dermatophagoides farinae]|uniref:Uncharacterized protein n=1 Tax=Dermatophagoides farinae TaxID=6954 RepID=A0A9D4SK76_DERFA|nr:putative uncharacterized protein DDB_G0289041 [Dermatophagoides farinae]KAH7644932.1 hypothetical protein HUG17_0470 [Dermatophagoides farinae]
MDITVIIFIFWTSSLFVLTCSYDEQWPIITTIDMIDIHDGQESITMNQNVITSTLITSTIQSDEQSESMTTMTNMNKIDEQIVDNFRPTVDDDGQQKLNNDKINRLNTNGQIDNCCLNNQTITEIEKIVETIVKNMKSSIILAIYENITETLNVNQIISTTVDSIINSTSKPNVDEITIVPYNGENITETTMKSMNRTRVNLTNNNNNNNNIINTAGQWFTIWIWLLLLQIEIILLIAIIAICILMRKNSYNNNDDDDDGDGIKSISKYDLAFDNNGMIIDQSSSNISSSINENCLFQMSSQSTQPPPPPTLEIQRQMIFKSEKFQRKLSEPLSIEKTNPSTSGGSGQYWLWARPSTPIMKNVNKIVMNECRL